MKFYLALGMAFVTTTFIAIVEPDASLTLKVLAFPVFFMFFRMILWGKDD